ncbi:phage tail protein [Sphingopyxis sp. BSNA05]|uniref:phage tail protein n=1 Tax=Sphingopyxis sp. BSNA05 TaxID=1236614 RepID=UPI0015641A09|nr:tail fiber protein [Sphingopyxis sp. BSNA05]NRD88602.1 phage tail protein [Sphingopyxis sp. BSNA05]
MKLTRTISITFALGGISLATAAPAHAQAGTQYIAQVSAFAGNFCPRGWLGANGTLLPISQHTALFSLLGTIYGGDGRTTFALPDLRGRRPISDGNAPGLGTYPLGSRAGATTFTLNVGNLPSHNHIGTMRASNLPGDTANPNSNSLATTGSATIYHTGAPAVNMDTGTVITNNAGGNQTVQKQSPYQVIRWCIATVGIYPSRN